MGFLSGTSCYLVGPIENDPGFGKDWRAVVQSRLDGYGTKVYNPLNRQKWANEYWPYTPPDLSRAEILEKYYNNDDSDKVAAAQKFIRDICLRYIHTCDFVFLYLSKSPTYGTTEELSIASNAGKPIIAVLPDDYPSLWVFDMLKGNPVFKHTADALQYLDSIDLGTEELDALKWIFIGEEYGLKKIKRICVD